MKKLLLPILISTVLLSGCDYTDKVKNSVTSIFSKNDTAQLDAKKFYTPSPLQTDAELQKQINAQLQKEISPEKLKQVENVNLENLKFVSLADYIKKRISDDGFAVEWRLKGEYFTDDQSLPTYEQIGLGMFLNSINMNMYNQNINRYIAYKMNPQNKTEFPHPLLVFFALCGKKIVAVEKDTLSEFELAIQSGELSGCSKVPQDLKLRVSGTLPPFAQAYDPKLQQINGQNNNSLQNKMKNNPAYQKLVESMLTDAQKKQINDALAKEGIKVP